MLSIEKAKKLLNDPNLSDEEIEKIRDELHGLAELIYDSWIETKRSK